MECFLPTHRIETKLMLVCSDLRSPDANNQVRMFRIRIRKLLTPSDKVFFVDPTGALCCKASGHGIDALGTLSCTSDSNGRPDE